MSKREAQNLPVIEWSSSAVRAYEPLTKQHYSGTSISEVARNLDGHKEVVVVLSRRSSFVRALRVPDAAKDQVEQVLKITLPNSLPIEGNDIAFDFRLSKSLNDEGRLAVVGAVASTTLKQILLDLSAAGLTPKQVAPAAFGSWLLARSLDLSDCAVVDRVPEGLAIDIVSDDELRYSRVVPFPKDSEGIEAEVCRTFSIAKVQCAHIVAAGGLAFSGAETTVATPPTELFGTIHRSKLDLDIELPEKLEATKRAVVRTKARIALLLWLFTLVCAAYVLMDRADAAAKAKRSNALWQAQLRQINSRLSDAKAEASDEVGLQTALDAAFHPGQRVSDVVVALSQAVPANVWIGGVTLERGKALLVRGTALSSDAVAAYVQTLAADSRFRDVKLVFANNGTLENTPIVQFSIQAHVMGNLPLSNPFGTGAKK